MVSLLSTTKIHHEGTSKHHEGISKSIHSSDFKVIVQDSWTLPTNLWSSSMGTLISTRNHTKNIFCNRDYNLLPIGVQAWTLYSPII